MALLIAAPAGCAGRSAVAPLSGPSQVRSVTVYVANSESDTVTPILAATNKAGAPIRVGAGPEQIVISPDGTTAYVAGQRDNGNHPSPATLTVIRTATNTPVKILTMCRAAAFGGPRMALTPDGKTLYYLCPTASRVIPFRTRTLTPGRPIVMPYPGDIAITPDGRTAYIANNGATTITPVSTATNMAGKAITVGLGPQAIAITPDGRTAYVVTPYHVTPVSTATNTPGKPISIQGGGAIAIAPDGATAYVVSTPNPDSYQGFVVPIRVATNTAGTPIRVGTYPIGIAVTPDGRTAYVPNLGSGTITPIHLATRTTGQAITVGKAPEALAITPDGTTAYVVHSILSLTGTPGWVTPIHLAAGTPGTPIPVGLFPVDVAIAP